MVKKYVKQVSYSSWVCLTEVFSSQESSFNNLYGKIEKLNQQNFTENFAINSTIANNMNNKPNEKKNQNGMKNFWNEKKTIKVEIFSIRLRESELAQSATKWKFFTKCNFLVYNRSRNEQNDRRLTKRC